MLGISSTCLQDGFRMRRHVARSWSLTRLGFTDSEGWRSFNEVKALRNIRSDVSQSSRIDHRPVPWVQEIHDNKRERTQDFRFARRGAEIQMRKLSDARGQRAEPLTA